MPDPRQAAPGDDLIAIGADLEPGTLLAAYRAGLFPMPVDPRRRRQQDRVVLARPRGIIPLDGLHVSRSMRTSFKRFEIRVDTAFAEVMQRCGDPSRPGRWITDEIVDGLRRAVRPRMGALDRGVARRSSSSAGCTGSRIDGLFAGESMFHIATDASKVALMALVDWLHERRRRTARRPVDHAAPALARSDRRAAPRLPRQSARSTPLRRRDQLRKIVRAGGPPPPALRPSPAESAIRPTGFPPKGNLRDQQPTVHEGEGGSIALARICPVGRSFLRTVRRT